MHVRFLTDPDALRANWPHIALLLASVVEDASRGEFTLDDLRELCSTGRMIAGICTDEQGLKMAMVFEFKHYPQQLALNIVALGGRDLGSLSAAHWATFCAWAKDAGATHIEALCSRAMARMLKTACGFSSTYEQVRLPL